MYIADLHCDLLSYLAKSKERSINDDVSRCSLHQLKKGHVAFQTLAIYEETKAGSAKSGESQFAIFQSLPSTWPKAFSHFDTYLLPNKKISICLAIENASCLCEEEETLDLAFQRLDRFLQKVKRILYISLTWNQENRFAGGVLSNRGLKADGKLFLEYLSGKNIAIDLSHASDQTAEEILQTIAKKNLTIPVMASHSNFRAVTDAPRNLPDFLAKEIIARKGVIGLNFVTKFMGENFQEDILRQIEHCYKLGGAKNLALGADFFYTKDFEKNLTPISFAPSFGDASCYPSLFFYLSTFFPKENLEDIAYKNVEAFLGITKEKK